MEKYHLKNNYNKQTFTSKIKTIIFDCDGVLWIQNKLINKAIDLINHLQNSQNFQIFFVTNNSITDAGSYLNKFRSKGFASNISVDQIFCASKVTAYQMQKLGYKKCLVLGSSGLEKELNGYDIQTVSYSSEIRQYLRENSNENKQLQAEVHDENLQLEEGVDSIVTGLFPDLNYQHLAIAASYLKKYASSGKHLDLIATNPDTNLPANDEQIYLPDAALNIAILENLQSLFNNELKKTKIFGKPYNYAFDLIKNLPNDKLKFPVLPEETLMIGDRVDTDMIFGRNFGSRMNLLVLSGHSKEDAINQLVNSENHEEFYIDSVQELFEFLQE